jgi:hypothetical protein
MNLRTVLGQICAVFCKNLLICDFRINHENMWICDVRPGTPQKFVDLLERKEHKNVSICGLQTLKKKFACPLVDNSQYNVK